ncbi:hypothetical protein WN51_01538 [Melipona quadrifasciata]|uniref:Uncharacterized protein n=1 Tax=Melipona quadrifasciata TaxID=166423 RepID=A0A0N0BEV8_9HYME|nr:hypothetical protein WN51_01538 [Melipona quadrifasciata]
MNLKYIYYQSIVENQYVAESDAGSSVCDLARGLERMLGEKNSVATMKSKKQQKNALARVVDPIEENETYDEFDTVRMPIVRSLSKSPQSDEGIEADTDRRRGSMARCWSLDSAAASDEDTSLTIHQQKRHKLRVTRCCSSDSAVLSDEDQIKGWDSTSMMEGSETEHNEGRPRYWRTPSVVVSDYSDYSYLDEKLERNDLDLEKYEGTSGTPSQASSCSCLDCDEIRESLDTQFLQVCRSSRRHSDSCCLCIDSVNAVAVRNFNEAGNRRNSCLDSTDSYYTKLDAQFTRYPNSPDLQEKTKVGFLNIPPARKISDCSITSSLSGDESDVAEPQVVKTSKIEGKGLCVAECHITNVTVPVKRSFLQKFAKNEEIFLTAIERILRYIFRDCEVQSSRILDLKTSVLKGVLETSTSMQFDYHPRRKKKNSRSRDDFLREQHRQRTGSVCYTNNRIFFVYAIKVPLPLTKQLRMGSCSKLFNRAYPQHSESLKLKRFGRNNRDVFLMATESKLSNLALFIARYDDLLPSDKNSNSRNITRNRLLLSSHIVQEVSLGRSTMNIWKLRIIWLKGSSFGKKGSYFCLIHGVLRPCLSRESIPENKHLKRGKIGRDICDVEELGKYVTSISESNTGSLRKSTLQPKRM